MKRYKFNLSKAMTASRNKRSKKAMSILREKLEEAEGDVSISPELNQMIWREGGSNPPNKIEVEIEETGGRKMATPVEKSPSEDTDEGSAPDEGVDYEEIVSGTVGEAKDEIYELEEPDYEALLEAEKEGKDRKTLKEFIEGKME